MKKLLLTLAIAFTIANSATAEELDLTPGKTDSIITQVLRQHPRMILLDHGQFKRLEYQDYNCRIVYALNMGYGFQRGPFSAYIQIYKERCSTERLWKLEIYNLDYYGGPPLD
jgi:hypothetical protein